MSSSADTAFTEAVDTVLSEWGEPFSAASTELTDALQELYHAELQFPPIWPEHRRRAFIAHHADIDAAELSTQFDDLIDTVTNEFGLAYGILPHPDDAAELITTARRQALEEFIDRRLNYELPDEIEDVQTENLGRGEASMTACGPTQRRRSRATLMRDPTTT
ncbi:hypothetical protein B7435_14190 [Mycolicibacterium peregrinum]|jgi:hypothetical protein|uniref:hypothetical protein n=1 Tax=Mycobacteriaceae TaxID=1762 RepID=UPI000B4AFDCE|nr:MULTISPECIES: hypothetical protein [Mycobacteriaceae]MDO3052140.1 hypothetical protein [Mycobacteroides abscessus subsp. abscessus]OWM02732.1 hypothetical protein B7435_14190 [Mycolicibacterium peregrinum]